MHYCSYCSHYSVRYISTDVYLTLNISTDVPSLVTPSAACQSSQHTVEDVLCSPSTHQVPYIRTSARTASSLLVLTVLWLCPVLQRATTTPPAPHIVRVVLQCAPASLCTSMLVELCALPFVLTRFHRALSQLETSVPASHAAPAYTGSALCHFLQGVSNWLVLVTGWCNIHLSLSTLAARHVRQASSMVRGPCTQLLLLLHVLAWALRPAASLPILPPGACLAPATLLSTAQASLKGTVPTTAITFCCCC
jgi:hypothetical protein